MMTKGQRFLTDEFRQEAVALLETRGRPLEHIADRPHNPVSIRLVLPHFAWKG